MAVSAMQIRSFLGEADVLILRKTVLCHPHGARSGQPGVPNKLLDLLVWEMPCDYILTGPGWENAWLEG